MKRATKYISALIITAVVVSITMAGCELPRRREPAAVYQFTGFSSFQIEQRAEVLSVDALLALQRFLDYRGANEYQAFTLFRDAWDILTELRNCYYELDHIRSREDGEYNRYKAVPEYEDRLVGINYYSLMQQTENTMESLVSIFSSQFDEGKWRGAEFIGHDF